MERGKKEVDMERKEGEMESIVEGKGIWRRGRKRGRSVKNERAREKGIRKR